MWQKLHYPPQYGDRKAEIEKAFNEILKKALAIDPTLEKTVLAEKTKQLQGVEIIEAKLLKLKSKKTKPQLIK